MGYSGVFFNFGEEKVKKVSFGFLLGGVRISLFRVVDRLVWGRLV